MDMKHFILTLAPIAVLACGLAYASPPPVPDEMLYPNVAPPTVQFGTYGERQDQLNEPAGAAFSEDGKLYVADVYNHRIKIFDASGALIGGWGGLGTAKGRFRFPHDVALSGDEVFVSDTGNNRIQVFSRDGRFRRSFGSVGSGRGQLNEPQGISAEGDLVAVADTGNERVTLFSAAGEPAGSFGESGHGDAQFDVPSDVAVDARHNIYVSDSYNNRIQKFDHDGRFLKAWGGWGSYSGLLATPASISLAGDRLFVADVINHRIQVFDTEGNFKFQWGRHPVAAHEGHGRLHYPSTIAATPSGKTIAVCEPFEYRCQIFASDTFAQVAAVNDRAWWDKNGRFHYGSRAASAGEVLAIAEPDTHSVLVFDIGGAVPQLIAKLGGQGRELGNLVRPSGMVIEPEAGLIHVADGGNHRIQTYQLQHNPGAQRGFVPNVARVVRARSMIGVGLPSISAQGFDGSAHSPVEPGCMKDGGNGTIYVCDPHNGRVLVLNHNLDLVRVIGSRGSRPGQMLVPSDVATSADQKTVYVVDTYNFRINAYDTNGRLRFSWGTPGPRQGQFIHPFSIASDRHGFLYISDDAANRIQKFDEQGRFVLAWGRWGTEPGQFYKPKGITIDDKGRLFLSDFGNHRAQVMDLNGRFLQMFGIGEGYTLPLSIASSHSSLSTNGARETSNGGHYLLTFEPSAKPIALNEEFRLRLRIVDARTGGPARGVNLRVTATMPAHYHGMNREPRVRQLADGTWEVENMLLHMPGQWQINFDIGEGAATERAQLDVTVA
jgi:tripartite motif-containing protein 71